MKFKKIAAYSLLLLTTQCFTIDYRTIGRRVFKTIGGVIAVPLTVDFAQNIPISKKTIAHHEAAHIIVAEKTNQNTILAQLLCETITPFKITLGGYVATGPAIINSLDDCDELINNRIKLATAGVIQDVKNKSHFARLNFMEQELNLPTTKQPCNNTEKLNFFLEKSHYIVDRQVIVNSIAEISNAKALLKAEYDKDEITIDELMHKNFIAATLLVNNHQPAIKRIAEALEEKATLTGDEIRKLIDQTT